MQNVTQEWQEFIYLTSVVTSVGSFKGQKGRRALLTSMFGCGLLPLLSSSFSAQAQEHQSQTEGEKNGMKKKKNFSNLLCYQTEKKEPWLRILNKPFQWGLEEPSESGQANCDREKLDGDFSHYPVFLTPVPSRSPVHPQEMAMAKGEIPRLL